MFSPQHRERSNVCDQTGEIIINIYTYLIYDFLCSFFLQVAVDSFIVWSYIVFHSIVSKKPLDTNARRRNRSTHTLNILNWNSIIDT